MKTTEAEVVQKKYLSVKAIISDEILQLQKDINQQDDNIIKIKNELPQLIAVVENARQSNQLIEKQLNQQDELFQKQKNDWEKALMMYHQQVEEVQFSDTSEDEKSVEVRRKHHHFQGE